MKNDLNNYVTYNGINPDGNTEITLYKSNEPDLDSLILTNSDPKSFYSCSAS